MVHAEILSQAADSFGFDRDTLTFVSNSCNEVYSFQKGNSTYFLRLSEQAPEFEDYIKAEVHWVRHLAKRGVRVSLPIHTHTGELTTVCRDDKACYIATVFEGAPGKFFDNVPELWRSTLFQTWGETQQE